MSKFQLLQMPKNIVNRHKYSLTVILALFTKHAIRSVFVCLESFLHLAIQIRFQKLGTCLI